MIKYIKNIKNAEKSFKNVHSRIITLRKIINNEEKNLQIVLDKYKKQITSLEFETKEIDNKIKEKEKVSIKNSSIKLFKKNQGNYNGR